MLALLNRLLLKFAGVPEVAGPAEKLRDVGPDLPAVSDRAKWDGDRLVATGSQPGAVRCLEVPLDRAEGVRLELRFTMSTDLKTGGNAYPEMWVAVENRGEAFSKGLQYTAKGTSGPVTCVLPFYLKRGEVGTRVTVKVVFGGLGDGTVTLSDLELWAAPLEEK